MALTWITVLYRLLSALQHSYMQPLQCMLLITSLFTWIVGWGALRYTVDALWDTPLFDF